MINGFSKIFIINIVFVNQADIKRGKLIEATLRGEKIDNNRIKFVSAGNVFLYNEILTLPEIRLITENYTTHSNVSEFLGDLVFNRLSKIFEGQDMLIDTANTDINTSDLYDGYELNVPLRKKKTNRFESIFTEIDKHVNPQIKNAATDTPIHLEPNKEKTPNLPQTTGQKTQNPRRVDLILNSTFNEHFNKYELSSDVGKWAAIKTIKSDGKLLITWESVKESSIIIETLIFPNDTNKVIVEVKNRTGKIFLTHYFEIYRIPTNEYVAMKFFRKTLFNLLKKYIDTNVITVEPFNQDFVFWRTDNPNFSYSFSTPNKNKILLSLISFISTATKPILDDFFEANNLKHKQGYLQTLLDSAEAAGIFKFQREGNEIIILRGPNYKAFLQGKIRRVVV